MIILKSRNIRTDDKFWKAVDDLAKELHTTKSEIIRLAVLRLLKDMGKDKETK